jgi:arylsulfatase A-like enzyme
VNPHAPYEPPAPFDAAFLDAQAARGPVLPPVNGFHGGVARQWAKGARSLGFYVAQYDGEIAAADAEVGHVLEALEHSAVRDQTLVLLASDHGESPGEHDYFDHGENLFDPSLRIPLVLAGSSGRRSSELASTPRHRPTLPDALKVSLPAGPRRSEPARCRARRAARTPAAAGAERPHPARGLGPASSGDVLPERLELRALRPS